MPRLKVILPELNIRIAPVNDLQDKANIIGVVFKDYSFEGEELAFNGQKWYKDRDGYFYWGGGVSFEERGFDYKSIIEHFNAPWVTSDGRNTRVAILDTGVNSKEVFFNSSLISEIDLSGNISTDKDHGTFICGIIAGANGPIKGLVPRARIASVRIKDENTPLERIFDNLIRGLRHVNELRQNDNQTRLIVNISQGFGRSQVQQHPNKVQEIETIIKELASHNVLVFCAAGENGQLVENNLLFPASLDDTISVGCITSQNTSISFAKSINLVMPFQEFTSYNSSHSIIQDSGSSFSVALITAIAAKIANNASNFTRTHFMNEITPLSLQTTELDFGNPECQFCLLNN